MSKGWGKHGVEHNGAHAGYDQKPLAEAEAAFIAEYEPESHELGWWRTGYYIGQTNRIIRWFEQVVKYANREDIIALADDLRPIADKWGFADHLQRMAEHAARREDRENA